MFRALFFKELRDGLPIALAGFLVEIWMAAWLINPGADRRTFVLEWSEPQIGTGIAAIGLGVLLGLWQTLPETLLGTYGFLFHSARNPARIVGAKIAAALALYLGAIALPLVVAIGWLVSETDRVVPLQWSDSRYFWVIASSGFVAYLGALSAGIRGAPWKEGVRQLAGAGVVVSGILVALGSPFFGTAVGALISTGAAAAVWAFTGVSRREF
jgi:hypothetical protein